MHITTRRKHLLNQIGHSIKVIGTETKHRHALSASHTLHRQLNWPRNIPRNRVIVQVNQKNEYPQTIHGVVQPRPGHFRPTRRLQRVAY